MFYLYASLTCLVIILNESYILAWWKKLYFVAHLLYSWVISNFVCLYAKTSSHSKRATVIFLNLWPWPFTFHLIFLARLPASMEYIYTKFGCDNSSCLLINTNTQTHYSTNTDDHHILRHHYRRHAGMHSWHDINQIRSNVALIWR